jgi:enoyl-CoA hydratase
MKDKECKTQQKRLVYNFENTRFLRIQNSFRRVQEQFLGGLGLHDHNSKTHHRCRQRIRRASLNPTTSVSVPLSNLVLFNLYQLGGGCELALMCDIILCSPTAVFGQPEINLGVIPGAGGSQRLTRVIGKSRAMELMLTGRNFTAVEAERWGVVSRIVEPVEGKGGVLEEAIETAKTIAAKPQLAVQATKETVNAGTLPPFMNLCLAST